MYPLIRSLWLEDLEVIIRIEQSSYPFPWTKGIFTECLRVGYACFGMQLDDQLVGYTISNWGAGESHLLNLCIHPNSRKQGLGKMLLEHSISYARTLESHVMFLEVRPSNVDAGRLYRKRGFTEVGVRPAYYQIEGGREDALIMRLDLVEDSKD